MIPRLYALARRVPLLLLAGPLAFATLALPAPAQDLLPLEQLALSSTAAGDRQAAVTSLLELATATAQSTSDPTAAARVEAWLEHAALLMAESGRTVPLAAFAALQQSPLATAQPMLRDRIAALLVTLTATDATLPSAALADAAGCVPEYWLIGPFDNERGSGYRRSQALEQRLDLDAELDGKRRAVRWRRLPLLAGARAVPLDRIVHPHEQSLVYAAVALIAKAPAELVLELGTTGSFRVFCNGLESGSREVERPWRLDQDAVRLSLQTGPNLLLLKLCHQEGAEFKFSARLRCLDGTPAPTVTTSCEPADLRAAAAVAAAAPAATTTEPRPIPLGGRSLWPIATTTGADALRLAWLWQARAADGDLDRRDLAAAQRAAAELPKVAESHLLLAKARTSSRRSEADRDDNDRRRALEEALALEPTHATALVELGELLRDGSHLWRSARTLADRSLAVRATSEAVLLRYHCLQDEGLGAKADQELVGFASGDPSPTLELLREAAVAVEGQRPAAALALRQRVLRQSHAEDDTAAVASLLLRSGQTGPALELLTAALAQDPYASRLRIQLAEHHLATGDPRAALQLLEAWLAIAPDDASAMVFASRCWRLLDGTVDDAKGQQLALLRSALEVEPTRRDDERYAEYLTAAGSSEAEPFYTAYRHDGPEVVRNDPGAPADAATAHDALHWLLRQRVIRANGNGTTSEYRHQIVRVLSEEGARQLANYRLPHWRGEQRARLLSCAILRPDSPLQRPALRGASVALPNLRPGDIVLVEGRIDDLAPSFFGDYFGLVHDFAADEGSPVARSELVVLADPGRSYRHQSVNGAPEPQQDSLTDGTLRFRWLVENLPRDVPELRRPDRKEFDPLVRMTTYRDWDHFAGWWWNLIKNQLEVTPAMRTTVQQLCVGLDTTEQKIAAIYRFVTTDVRYEAWEFGVHGYKPYSTAVIHERRHGDCKDKALLLCALLGEISVPCQPVLIFADPMRSRDDLGLAMVQQFNHCIAWLPAHDGRPGRFLDGTATWHPTDTLPEMDQGAHVLVVDSGRAELREVPRTTPQQNREQDDYAVTLRADGSAEVAVKFRPLGNFAVELRSMTATEPARRTEQLERRLTSLLGKLELSDVQSSDGLDLRAPVEVSATARLPELGQRQGERWQLPSTWQYGDLQVLASETERRTPLLLGVPTGDHQTVRYRVPPGWRATELPTAVQQQTPFGAFSMRWSREGDQVVVDRTLEFAVPRIEPGQYPAFREFIATVKAADAQLVLLQKESGR